MRLHLPSRFLEDPPRDLTGLAFLSPSEDLGEPTCTVLGTEARSSSLFPVSSPDAAVELLGSESRMSSGECGRGDAFESGSLIHMQVP